MFGPRDHPQPTAPPSPAEELNYVLPPLTNALGAGEGRSRTARDHATRRNHRNSAGRRGWLERVACKCPPRGHYRCCPHRELDLRLHSCPDGQRRPEAVQRRTLTTPCQFQEKCDLALRNFGFPCKVACKSLSWNPQPPQPRSGLWKPPWIAQRNGLGNA
jgi:hypothetical protein